MYQTQARNSSSALLFTDVHGRVIFVDFYFLKNVEILC